MIMIVDHEREARKEAREQEAHDKCFENPQTMRAILWLTSEVEGSVRDVQGNRRIGSGFEPSERE